MKLARGWGGIGRCPPISTSITLPSPFIDQGFLGTSTKLHWTSFYTLDCLSATLCGFILCRLPSIQWSKKRIQNLFIYLCNYSKLITISPSGWKCEARLHFFPFFEKKKYFFFYSSTFCKPKQFLCLEFQFAIKIKVVRNFISFLIIIFWNFFIHI